MIEVEAVAMETQLQALRSSCDLLDELCDATGAGSDEEREGVGEGVSDAAREKGEVEARHRQLLVDLARLKELLNAELLE